MLRRTVPQNMSGGSCLTLSFLLLNSWQSGNKLTDPEPFNLMRPRCIETADLGNIAGEETDRQQQVLVGQPSSSCSLSPRFPTPIGPAGLIQGCLMVEMQIGCMYMYVSTCCDPRFIKVLNSLGCSGTCDLKQRKGFSWTTSATTRVSRFRNHGGSLVPEVSCNWSVVYLS